MLDKAEFSRVLESLQDKLKSSKPSCGSYESSAESLNTNVTLSPVSEGTATGSGEGSGSGSAPGIEHQISMEMNDDHLALHPSANAILNSLLHTAATAEASRPAHIHWWGGSFESEIEVRVLAISP